MVKIKINLSYVRAVSQTIFLTIFILTFTVFAESDTTGFSLTTVDRKNIDKIFLDAINLANEGKYDQALAICDSFIALPVNNDNWATVFAAYEIKIGFLGNKEKNRYNSKVLACMLKELSRFENQYQIQDGYFKVPIPYVFLPNIYEELGKCNFALGNYTSAQYYYKQAQKIIQAGTEKRIQAIKMPSIEANEIRYEAKRGYAIEIGECEMKLGRYKEALANYFQAEKFFADNGTVSNPTRRSRVDYLAYTANGELPKKIGDCYQALGDLKKSQAYYQKAYKYLQQPLPFAIGTTNNQKTYSVETSYFHYLERKTLKAELEKLITSKEVPK